MQLIQQHVGPQERVAVGGTSIPLHAVIQRMLLSLWYMEKYWSNKIGLTNKEVEPYRWTVGQFANDWRVLQWQPTVWVHWTRVHPGWFAAEYRNLYIFSRIPTERRNLEFKMDIHHSFLGWGGGGCRPHPVWPVACMISEMYINIPAILNLHGRQLPNNPKRGMKENSPLYPNLFLLHYVILLQETLDDQPAANLHVLCAM